ncbi:MAG TPA: adenosylcobinamide-GDP ribazoletransferase [Nocardioides sp.]|nr:adenosylcobinamide-GDP ribazoletransferase [Nocardioides sp.]
MNAAGAGRSLRLSVGMLTALRVPPVLRVTPGTATGALVLAPLAVLPLGALVGVACWLGTRLDLPSLAVAFAALGLLAMGSRALHLDGLSDVADGLTASYDRERSLAVMKGGAAGPAGVVAVVVVLGTQAAGLSGLVGSAGLRECVFAGAAVCASRASLWITCCSLVPPAREDGLGLTFTRRVPVAAAAFGWLGVAGLATLLDPVAGPVTVGVAGLVVVLLVWRAVRRFGGVTGDVFGAAIELALAVLLVGIAVSVGA